MLGRPLHPPHLHNNPNKQAQHAVRRCAGSSDCRILIPPCAASASSMRFWNWTRATSTPSAAWQARPTCYARRRMMRCALDASAAARGCDAAGSVHLPAAAHCLGIRAPGQPARESGQPVSAGSARTLHAAMPLTARFLSEWLQPAADLGDPLLPEPRAPTPAPSPP
eukprot:359919-Chlamydomonas_euryale.AAC.2